MKKLLIIGLLALTACTKAELTNCKIYLEAGESIDHIQATAYDDDGNLLDATECEIIYL